MTPDAPIVKDLVLVGGGHSHVAVLKRFGMRPMPGVRVTLITRDIDTPYSGMLPGFVAGHYPFDECHIDLAPLARFARARLIHDEAVGIDRAARAVLCRNRPPVPFDVLSLDIGSRPKAHEVDGAAEHATPVKPIDGFAVRWAKVMEHVAAAPGEFRIGVVGGGAGGVELILAMRHRLRTLDGQAGRDHERLRFHLVTADGLLPTHNARVQAIFRRALRERAIAVRENAAVVRVDPGALVLADGSTLALDEILWTTQAGAAPWLARSGLDCDPDGFVKVAPTLQSLSDPLVFAAGDVAAVVAHPRPKAGVFAVRQGAPLAENLRRVLAGQSPRPFTPQTRFLSLISTGDKYAVASRGSWAAEGRWLWRLKDWIDRAFMRKYSELPAMAEPGATALVAGGVADRAALAELSAVAMRCGGCGAKIGAAVLSRVMARLAPIARPDIVVGLDAADDAAVVRPEAGRAMVHTVDFFRDFVGDPYLFGQIAANHSLGDVFAMGADPRTALAIATVPYGIEAKVEDNLFQLMAGAVRVLDAAGCALVGGHSAEGAELALGFAVNGTVAEAALLRKGGLVPGQALILTKPVGTGALFAAAMRGRARGRWIDAAIGSMLVSAKDAADCLRRHGATAMTDVTGFGVIGHLAEMAKPAAIDLEIDPAAVPLLDGALDCVRAGIFSSLQPQNLRLRRALDDPRRADDPRITLLFDPQTAGGLIAGVPDEAAAAAVAELRALGYPHAAVIGRVLARAGGELAIRMGQGLARTA